MNDLLDYRPSSLKIINPENTSRATKILKLVKQQRVRTRVCVILWQQQIYGRCKTMIFCIYKINTTLGFVFTVFLFLSQGNNFPFSQVFFLP